MRKNITRFLSLIIILSFFSSTGVLSQSTGEISLKEVTSQSSQQPQQPQ
ncbi:MAG: hypothetical protein FD167_3977, partial [bacterium]